MEEKFHLMKIKSLLVVVQMLQKNCSENSQESSNKSISRYGCFKHIRSSLICNERRERLEALHHYQLKDTIMMLGPSGFHFEPYVGNLIQ